jgi:hypothetical protein
LQNLTIRGIAMSTVAYITALTIGVFAVTLVKSEAANAEATQSTAKEAAPKVVDPIDVIRESKELTGEQLTYLLREVGFKGHALKTAWAVVMRESRAHPKSHNKNASTGDNSYGLFQINMIGSLGEVRREKFGIQKDADLFDPVVNAKAAYFMTAQGTNWGSWGLGPDAYDGDAIEPAVTVWFDDFAALKSKA